MSEKITQFIANSEESKELAKIGVIATGTHFGTQLIHKIAAKPLLVFSIGLIAGIALHRNLRKQTTADEAPSCCGGGGASHEEDES